MKILAHTSFIGTTGYNNHSRSFFCSLNKYHTVKIRNLTIGDEWSGYSDQPHNESYVTNEMRDMMILQTLYNSDGSSTDYPIYGYQGDFKADVHIVLNDMNNHYFYQDYDGYKIAYNVWETTRYPDDFFNRLFYFDEVWVPSKWQKDCLIEQGYPENRISIVTEGVDVETFYPAKQEKRDKFQFLLFGRWEYRKSTTEIIKTFIEKFKDIDNVEMICSVENPYPYDGMNSTQERLDYYSITSDKLKIVNFPSRDKYVKYLQNGDVFVSCARSEGWNLPLSEALACGTPSIYSNWGAQLEFADGIGIPVNVLGLKDANVEHKNMVGQFCEPDFDDLGNKMMEVYNNYNSFKNKALRDSEKIHENFNWDVVARKASDILKAKSKKSFVFVTTGNIGYMPVIEKLVESLLEFSNAKILVYGIDCEVPFDYPNVIKRTISPPKHSEHDKWYWKQYACIESINEDFDYFIWVDGDVVVNHNIDEITQYFNNVPNYPISDLHLADEFFGYYQYNGETRSQSFNEELSKEWNIDKNIPLMHVCLFIYNKESKWWFEKIIERYLQTPLSEYKRLFLWNDEGIDNALRWEFNAMKHLPQVTNFDTSSYTGYDGFTNDTMNYFYKFWLEDGPQNFNQIFGYQFIPKDKNKILYFHGNKDRDISQEMIEYIKTIKNNNFFETEKFFTNQYKLDDFGKINGLEGSTLFVAENYGWSYAIYHEIYNLMDYYLDRQKRISDGDIVVDVGANIGIFSRWARQEGAGKIISFEPDKRYFKLLQLNVDENTILFNAAMSDKIGEVTIHETEHLGGSTINDIQNYVNKYKVRSYTLDYLFESKLIDKIDFLKIDVEGAEINVFNGISDENLNKVKYIAMEYHHSHFGFNEEVRFNLINRLNKLGFNSYVLFLGNNNALQLIYFYK